MTTPVTEQLVLPLDTEVTPTAEPSAEPAPRTSVLITEAEVVFSTAAAVALIATPVTDERPRRRHHPKRLPYLYDARMEREMHRL